MDTKMRAAGARMGWVGERTHRPAAQRIEQTWHTVMRDGDWMVMSERGPVAKCSWTHKKPRDQDAREGYLRRRERLAELVAGTDRLYWTLNELLRCDLTENEPHWEERMDQAMTDAGATLAWVDLILAGNKDGVASMAFPWVRDRTSGMSCDVRDAKGSAVAVCFGLRSPRSDTAHRAYAQESDRNAVLIAGIGDVYATIKDLVELDSAPDTEEWYAQQEAVMERGHRLMRASGWKLTSQWPAGGDHGNHNAPRNGKESRRGGRGRGRVHHA